LRCGRLTWRRGKPATPAKLIPFAAEPLGVLTPAALHVLLPGALALLALAFDPGSALSVGTLAFQAFSLQPLGQRLALWAHCRPHAAAG